MSEENKIRDALDAAKELAQTVPVYQDAIQPAAKQVGKGLETVAKSVTAALAPLRVLVWGIEQIETYLIASLSEKLKRTPSDRLVTPDPNVAGPALTALRFAGHHSSLRELYANLLATAMDAKTAKEAHPAFVEILRQLSPDEAKIIGLFGEKQNFPIIKILRKREDGKGYQDYSWYFSMIGADAKCTHRELTPTYIDNICRLGLAEIPAMIWLIGDENYERLENHPVALKAAEEINKEKGMKAEFERRFLRVTALGQQFWQACVAPRNDK